LVDDKVERELVKIVALAQKCPEAFQKSCFELLLKAYLDAQHQSSTPPPTRDEPKEVQRAIPLGGGTDWQANVPAEIRTRFQTLAKRKQVTPDALAVLFDFTTDPFTFAPFHVDGANKAERALKVAGLVGIKAWLMTGRHVADWAEVKSMCDHQGCLDMGNFSATIRKQQGAQFKSVEVGASIELSAVGVSDAEGLLAQLAGGTNAADQ